MRSILPAGKSLEFAGGSRLTFLMCCLGNFNLLCLGTHSLHLGIAPFTVLIISPQGIEYSAFNVDLQYYKVLRTPHEYLGGCRTMLQMPQ
jgi:hypothetical protein